MSLDFSSQPTRLSCCNVTLHQSFDETTNRHADKVAIYWGDDTFTYSSLREQTQNWARHLTRDQGVQPGDRVGLWLQNSPQFIPVLFGILSAGAVAIPINTFLKPAEVSYMLSDSGAKVLITNADRQPILGELTTAITGLSVVDVESLTNIPGETVLVSRKEEDLAVLIYTSGTTGHPKGAMLSHKNLLSNVQSTVQVLDVVETDRMVVVLPMFHSFMLCVGVILPALFAMPIVIIRSLSPPKNMLMELIRHKGTILPAVPQFFRMLSSAASTIPLPLRLCVSGGAPLPREILREFQQRMTVPLIEGYGLSEASPVVSLNPINGLQKEGSIGLPIPDVEICVKDDHGALIETGQTGEICVRGANVMLGYWNRPEETASTLRDGWLHTGDIGNVDTDGYWHITDRKKDMLIVNGINVYPREIEEILYQFPNVKEAAVVGVPDIKRGETPLAFVSMNEGTLLDEKLLHEHLRGKLADYKVPRQVRVLPALPRNATGKILKTQLRTLTASAD